MEELLQNLLLELSRGSVTKMEVAPAPEKRENRE
jgi:hypothetical protein